MKKRLSLLILMVMVISMIPAIGSAGGESAVEHLAYSESAPSGWTGTDVANATNNYNITYEDDAFVVQKKTDAGTNCAIRKQLSDFILENDTENNTRLLSNRISGKIVIELDYEMELKEKTTGTATFMNITFGASDETSGMSTRSLAVFRITSSEGKELRNHSATEAGSTSSAYLGRYLPLTWKDRSKFRLEIDVDNGLFDISVTDSTGEIVSFATYTLRNITAPYDYVKFFDSISLTFASSSMAEGSYFKLYGINVYKIEDSVEEVYAQAKSVFDQMPASLVPLGDPKNITDNVTVPSFEEFDATLSSSDSDIMNTDGEINRNPPDGYVSLFAEYSKTSTLATTPFIFKKAYDFTVNGTAEVSLTEGEDNQSFIVNGNARDGNVLIISVYDENRLSNVEIIPLNAGLRTDEVYEIEDYMEYDADYTYKAFWWNSIDGLKPATGGAEILPQSN